MRKNEIKKKNISANALSDDDLEDVAGGRTFPTPTTVVLTTPDGKEYVAEYPTPEAAKKAKLELLKQGIIFCIDFLHDGCCILCVVIRMILDNQFLITGSQIS